MSLNLRCSHKMGFREPNRLLRILLRGPTWVAGPTSFSRYEKLSREYSMQYVNSLSEAQAGTRRNLDNYVLAYGPSLLSSREDGLGSFARIEQGPHFNSSRQGSRDCVLESPSYFSGEPDKREDYTLHQSRGKIPYLWFYVLHLSLKLHVYRADSKSSSR